MDHAADLSHKGVVTNDSSDGRIKFEERFKKFATYSDLQEILILGESDPVRLVMNLIICDGDSKRTNRSLIFSNELEQIGVGFESHSKNNFISVINLTNNWKVRQINNPNIKDEDSKNLNKVSKLKDFKIEIQNENTHEDGHSFNLNLDENLIERYDKELDEQLLYENYIEKKEEKFILNEDKNKLKLLKKIIFTFPNGIVRKVILSKTWKV